MINALYSIFEAIGGVLAQVVGRDRGFLKQMSRDGGRWFSPES